jgi:hypothetical protein
MRPAPSEDNRLTYERVPIVPLRKADTPVQPFTIPADALRKLGGDSIALGHAVLHDLLGTHVMSGPLGTIPPDAVKAVGNGDPITGRKVLNKLVAIVRRQRRH